MWWYKIPALLVVAATSHISLSNQKLAKLRLKSSFVAYWLFAFRVFFWTLTGCEVILIWSTNHLRSPIAHRFLVILVHPWANFPPKLHLSLPLAIVWSTTLLSLAVHLACKSYYRRIRQSSASPDQVRRVSGKLVITRRALLGSSPAMGIGTTLCHVLPGSFAYECWVWRMRFGGILFCLMGISHLGFWLGVVVWRCARSRRRHGAPVLDVEGIGSSETSLEEDVVELPVMESQVATSSAAMDDV